MVNGKEKRLLREKFFMRSGLAKQLGLQNAAIDRLILRDIIVPDAWAILTSTLEQPLFAVERIEEIRTDVESHYAQLEAARLQTSGK
jgi:hypothetical protein